MSREKQIKEMVKIINKPCFEIFNEAGVSDKECPFPYECEECAARQLYNAGYRKQEWISVEDRLPHWSDGKVLVFTQYGFSICERTVNGRWKGQHANWITHWMPLPEPPKMKGGAE